MDTGVAQIVGFLAAIVGFWAVSQPCEKRIKQLLLVHTALYGFHFWLLGLYPAVVANVIAFARIWISIRSRSWLWVAILCTVSLVAGISANSFLLPAILPLAASFVLTVTLFRLTGSAFRIGLMAGSVLWLIHNIWAASYGGIVLETGMSLSILLGWHRYKKARLPGLLSGEKKEAPDKDRPN